MEVSNIWKDFIRQINNADTDLSQFRSIKPIRKIPLFEVKFYPDYTNFGYKVYFDSSVNTLDWRLAMHHSSHGYKNNSSEFHDDSYQLVDLLTSYTQLKCNHHFFKYKELTGRSILDFENIVELGGGCGDFAKFIFNLGYKGKYTIIDLPEVLKVQKYNLHGYGVKFTSDPVYNHSSKETLFISTWALSECPLEWRHQVVKSLQPSNWLITFQRQFENINNVEYFEKWEGSRLELPDIIWDGGSEYICK